MKVYKITTPKSVYYVEAENSHKMRKMVFEKEGINYEKIEPKFDDSIYWQQHSRYKGKKIGNTNTDMQIYGCALMCWSYVSRKDPLEVNKLFIENDVYYRDLIVFEKACKILGFRNYKKEFDINAMPEQAEIIKEVWLGKFQHFVVRFNKDQKRWIFDPWTGEEQPINYYRFRSYRIFDK